MTTSPSAGLGRRTTAMLVLLALASFVVILNAAALPIPLPSIMEDFGATLEEITWVLGAFLTVFALLLIPCARLGDICGRRQLFLTGISIIAVASAASAAAPSIGFLVTAQAVLGAGAAMVEPAIHATIRTTIPAQLQRRAFGIQAGGFFAGGALGPLLSGALTTALSWEFIFWMDTLLAVAVLIGAVLLLPDSRALYPPRRMDWPGLSSGALAVVALMFGLIEGATRGWGAPMITGSFVVSALAAALFAVVEARAAQPLVDLALFRYRRFAAGNVVRAATEFASIGIFFALSHFLQVQLGYSALSAGGLLMTVIAASIITASIAEKLTTRVDVRWLLLPGFALAAAGTYWTAHVTTDVDWTFFLAPLALFGAGIGLLESPADTLTRADLPAASSETGWRASYVTYLLGIALGVAVVSGVWQDRIVANVADTPFSDGIPGTLGRPDVFADAVNTALLSCVVVALVGLVTAVFAGKPKARSPQPDTG